MTNLDRILKSRDIALPTKVRLVKAMGKQWKQCQTSFWGLQNHSVQFISVTQSCPTLRPHEPQHARPPCPSLPKLMSIKSVMPSNHLILCRPLLLLPTIPPRIRVFSNESTLRMRWPKYWSFSFSIIPSKEIQG